MIRLPPGAVILEPHDVDYVARALEEFARLMAERRDTRGRPAPSQPSHRLQAVTEKLRGAVDSAGSLAVGDPAADHPEPIEPSAQPSDVRALQRDSVHGGRHELGTGDAARTLGITPGGVRDLARRGRLPARHTGTRWVYPADAVDAEAKHRAAHRAG